MMTQDSASSSLSKALEEAAKSVRESKIRRSGISVACADASLDSCVREVSQYARTMMHGGRCLFITGPTRAGKTWAASAIVRHALDAGLDARIITFQQLLDKVKESFDPAVIRTYSHVDVLAIDDLGREVPTDFAVSKLFQLVDERVSNRRPTIFTTTYDEMGLFKRLSSAGADKETCKCILSRICESSTKIELAHVKGRGYVE